MPAKRIREHIPLEQGLRLSNRQRLSYLLLNQRAYSIRTRIKTNELRLLVLGRLIREHIPLEQGLRQVYLPTKESFVVIREHIPLEQGLRLNCGNCCLMCCYQRAYSIRTRIKTAVPLTLNLSMLYQRAYSIRTRIKTRYDVITICIKRQSESIFH